MDCSTPGFSVLHYLPEFALISVEPITLTISSSATPFSFYPQSFPASGSLPMYRLFSMGGQSIGLSASASVLPMNIQGWFPWGSTGWCPCCPRDSQESSPAPQFEASVLWRAAFFIVQLSHQYMTSTVNSKTVQNDEYKIPRLLPGH